MAFRQGTAEPFSMKAGGQVGKLQAQNSRAASPTGDIEGHVKYTLEESRQPTTYAL